jgi:HK97 family phage portal protein
VGRSNQETEEWLKQIMADQRSLIQRLFGTAQPQASDKAAPSLVPDAGPYARGAYGLNTITKMSTEQLRRWSRNNPWIRAAVNLRRTQISRAKWDIVSNDAGDSPDPRTVQKLRDLFRRPNPKGESWRSFIEPVIEDILVLDQGAIEIEKKVGSRVGADPIAYLWNKDAARIAFDTTWDGRDESKPRYYELDSAGKQLAVYKNDELIVVIANPVTYSPIGLSPLEVLAETIAADLDAAAYNAKAVSQAAPPGVLHLGEGVRPEQVDSFKAYWEAEVAGKSQIAITGGGKGMQWLPLAASNRDMQFMEWQVYLARKICAVFAVQPQDIGISFDVNKSTSETGAAFTYDNGIVPLAELIAEYLTREVVARYDSDLRFVFTEIGRTAQQTIAEYNKMALGGLPWLRINDALRERGQDGIGEIGDQILFQTPKGYVPSDRYGEYLDTVVFGSSAVNEPPTPGGSDPNGAPNGEDMEPDPGSSNPPNQNPADLENSLKLTIEIDEAKSFGDTIIVSDIEGTLTASDGSDKVNEVVADYLRQKSETNLIFIVSSRSVKRLDETRAWLEANDIPHDAVYLSDFPAGASLQFKKYKMSKVIKEIGRVVEAIENDADVREAYRALGVSSVHGPADVADKHAAADYSGISLNVPSAVKAEAKRGLEWRQEFGRGGIGPGQTTARMLISNTMTIPRVRKMRAFLARHEVDKQGEGFKPGQPGFPSAGRIAWALWGGDAGVSWSNKIMRQVEARERKR